MIQTFNKGKVVLDTIAQFQTLSTTGTLVIDGVTITYDPDHYDYWIKEKDYYTQAETDRAIAERVEAVIETGTIPVYDEDADKDYTCRITVKNGYPVIVLTEAETTN